MTKGTHKTKDGRTAKKGLYYYMNRAKKRGTSKPGKGTVTDKALKASAELNCIVVLKGATTIIAGPDNKALVNPAGSKWLSTAGSGDVLAGIICGLLSNKMEIFKASAFGVWLHSEIGNYLGPGLVAEDLPININKVYKNLLKTIN